MSNFPKTKEEYLAMLYLQLQNKEFSSPEELANEYDLILHKLKKHYRGSEEEGSYQVEIY